MPFGDLMSPSPQAPQKAQDGQNLEQSWRDYLKNPAVQAGLMQFGLRMFQPMTPGQTGLGTIAQGIGEGAEAATRVKDRGIALKQQETENQLAGRRAAVDEGTLRAAEERNRLAGEQQFHQSVIDSPEYIESAAEAKARGEARGGLEGGGVGALTPSNMDFLLATVPQKILSGVATPMEIALFQQSVQEYTRDKPQEYRNPVTGQPEIITIRGGLLTNVQRQAMQKLGMSPAASPGVPPPSPGVPPAPGPGGSGAPGPSGAPTPVQPSPLSDFPAGSTIGQMANEGFVTGPIAWGLEIAGRTPGAIFQNATDVNNTTNARALIAGAKNDLITALSNNPRFPEGEAQRISKELDLDPRLWDNGSAMLNRLVAMDYNLLRRRQTVTQAASDKKSDPQTIIWAQNALRHIDAFRNILLPNVRAMDDVEIGAVMDDIRAGRIPPGTPILVKDGSGFRIIYSAGRAASPGAQNQPTPAPARPNPITEGNLRMD